MDTDTLIEEWCRYIATRHIHPKQIESRKYVLKSLSQKCDLLTLTPKHAAEWFASLDVNRPAKYFSQTIVNVMRDDWLSRPQIITRLKNTGVIFDQEKFTIALKNRRVFQFIAPNGNHRQGLYRAIVKSRALKPRSKNFYLLSAKMFYDWAINTGYICVNPFANISCIAETYSAEILFITRKERERTIAQKPLITIWIALYAGLRRGEIARLKWDDIDLKNCWIHVKKTKTGRPRHVPISPHLLRVLKRAKEKTGFVAQQWHGFPVAPEIKADAEINALARRLPDLAPKIRWNVFRHTFASLLAQTGKISIDQICAMMGNTPEVCRRHYAHLIPNSAEQTGIHLID